VRIIYFHQYFGTPQGAGGTRSYELSRALIEAGHDVTMVCASADRSAIGLDIPFHRGRRRGLVDGIDVIEFDLSYSNSDSIARRTWKFARFAARAVAVALREPYDLAFATSTPLTAGIPGIFAKLVRRKPFVFEVRDLWPELPRAMGMRNPLLLGAMSLLERASYAAADRVIGLAPGIVDGIARTGKPREAIALVPNGCDFELFGSVAPVHPAELFPDRIAREDFVAIFAGAHGVANGLDAVVDGAAALERRGRRDIKLLLVGRGSEKQRLQARATALGLSNLVFAEPVPKTTVAALIKGSGAGLQILANIPAFYEGTSPNKFFDYLAAGRPIVINYPGWLAREVEQEGCGIAVPPGDPDAFAEALVALCSDRDAAERMGIASAELGRKAYDRQELAGRFEQVLVAAGRAHA
jgi:glycosyltransferase involved in cell wall biosynthesis